MEKRDRMQGGAIAKALGHLVKSTAQPIERTAWRRAIPLAIMLHSAVGIALLMHFAGTPAEIHFEPQAMVQSSVAVVDESREITGADAGTDVTLDKPTNDVAVEPGNDYVSRAARSILDARDKPPALNALNELEKKARLVQELSSPAEIARIAGGVRSALGVEAMPDTVKSMNARGFDFNHCVVASAERIEKSDSVEIRETMRDRAGRHVVISYISRKNAKTGEAEFVQVHTNDKGELEEYPIAADEFADAESRQRPYQIINRFGLVKQIHDQAVLPLLEKFADEADEKERQTTKPTAE